MNTIVTKAEIRKKKNFDISSQDSGDYSGLQKVINN